MRRSFAVFAQRFATSPRLAIFFSLAVGLAATSTNFSPAFSRAADTTPTTKPAPANPTSGDHAAEHATKAADGADAAAAEKRLAESEKFLASDRLEGRGLGTNGINIAADYLAGKYRDLGLKTDLYDGQPFQKFTLSIGSKLGPADQNTIDLIGPAPAGKSAPEKRSLKLGVDFNPLAVGASGKFNLPLVFVGYGITAKGEKYDDYASVEVKDKAVVLLRHQPQRSDPHGLFGNHDSSYAAITRKVSNAYEHGAAAVIFCTDEEEIHRTVTQAEAYLQKSVDDLIHEDAEFKKIEKPSLEQIAAHAGKLDTFAGEIKKRRQRVADELDPLLAFDRGGDENDGRTIPVLHIRREAIDPMIRAALGSDLAKLEERIDTGPTPRSAALSGWRIAGQTDILRTKTPVKNVLAELPGVGPHADETLIVGAHYDHLGYGGFGSLAPGSHAIHPGADDNGSGTSALLEVARRLVARSKEHPFPRRILFISFTGEERGLLGSGGYVRDPLIPLDKTIAMLNMDMVGRMKDHKLIVYGTDTATEFPALLKAVAEPYGFKIISQPGGFGPSDHASFYAKHLPVLHFFTGTHSDYHRPTDTADKLNVPDMRRVADLVSDMAIALADAPQRPHFTESKVSMVTLSAQGDRPYFGSIPDFGHEQPGYAISGVASHSPAEEGGLKGGDVIVRFGESKIGNLEDFDSALRKHQAGDKVAVWVQRGKQEVKLQVTLAPPRG